MWWQRHGRRITRQYCSYDYELTFSCTMLRTNYHERLRKSYIQFMAIRNIINPTDDPGEIAQQLQLDLAVLEGIASTRYLRGRPKVRMFGNLHLAWEYAQNPEDHSRFINMLRVSPFIFEFILLLIQDHPVFTNDSTSPQAPVDSQLAVTLYRLGRFGNAASLEDIARVAGCSEGGVEN